MNPNLNELFNHFGLGQSGDSFDFTFQPPACAPSFPLPRSITSLPPELLTHVFESISGSTSGERRLTLASLCLVNRLFLDLTRPILYRQLDLEVGFFDMKILHQDCQLHQLLLSNQTCGKMVKVLRIVFVAQNGLGRGSLRHVLARLGGLETIEISWEALLMEQIGQEFVAEILRGRPNIKNLELPWVNFDYGRGGNWFEKFRKLETFIGELAGLDEPEPEELESRRPISCKLRRLVLSSPIVPSHFDRVSHSSQQSLRSLGFNIISGNADFDLSPFVNLTLLRIALNDDNGSMMTYPFSMQRVDAAGFAHAHLLRTSFIQTVRNIFRSFQALPLQTLAIHAEEDHVGRAIGGLLLQDVALPRTLVHFTATLPFLDPNSSLLNAVRNRSLPHFNRISILPEHDQVDVESEEDTLRSVCEEFGVTLDRIEMPQRAAVMGGRIAPFQRFDEFDEEDDELQEYLRDGGDGDGDEWMESFDLDESGWPILDL